MFIAHRSPDNQRKVTPYFVAADFACRCGKCPVSIISDRLIYLVEKVRIRFGDGLVITSAYRCWPHNAAVGGSRHSYHQGGMAVDFALPTDENHKRLLITLVSTIFPFHEVNEAKGYIHGDTRGRG